MNFYKNKNDRYESVDGHELTCGEPVIIDEDGQQIRGRIEHDGNDYYIFVSRNIRVKMLNGINLTIPKE